jgi:glycosyltransferase involved in cell wall biosynthesis
MQILFDHQTFTQQDYGGISQYFCELMTQLSKDPSLDFSISLRYSQNENLHRHSHLNPFWSNRNNFFSDNPFFSSFQKKIGFNLLNYVFKNQIESIRVLKKQNFDIFHPTYYEPYFLKYLQKKPYVLTVYDMIHELFPNYFSKDDLTTKWKKQLIENANVIIAISENTKKDIIKFTNIDPDQIQVIYLGNPFEKTIETRQFNNFLDPILESDPYLLFVGNRSGYKNFIFFIESIAELLQKDQDLHVFCAGGGSFNNIEKTILKKLNISQKVHYFQPNDFIMKNLYKNARAFIFPSLYEGFGLPILEAFSCGCPSLLSDKSSLPEVGGDAALYFDPYDSVSLTDAVDHLLSDDNLRSHLIRNGNERLKLFSWEITSNKTKKNYESLLIQ